MALDILAEKGVALDRQAFTWREMSGPPYSKLDDDAFTRVRVSLMSALEAQAVGLGHGLAPVNPELRGALARVRRVEQHQQTLVAWLSPPDESLLDTAIGLEQASVEITAAVAQREPDPYVAQVYRFGLLEDLDHLYRFAALMDRVEGRDANTLLQSYTDIRPGRPTARAHRDPVDDLRDPYDRGTASFFTRIGVRTVAACADRARQLYMDAGPRFTDPAARLLFAEIASIEEQHITAYESLADPGESPVERWLLQQASEVFSYWSCLEQEQNAAVRAIWQRLLDYELGHLHFVMDVMREIEGRDPTSLLPASLPDPLAHDGQREFVRRTLEHEVSLRPEGTRFVGGAPAGAEAQAEPADAPSARYRQQMNSDGSPSEVVAEGYCWVPGTELAARVARVPGRIS